LIRIAEIDSAIANIYKSSAASWSVAELSRPFNDELIGVGTV
jgi:hypothetical protein